jgi:AraC family transcriptional regulator
MTRSHLTARDPRSGSTISLIDDSCVLWSSGTDAWNGLMAEEHRLDALDTPQFEVPAHSVTIQLSSPATIEHKVNGEYHSHLLAPGDIQLFPAGAQVQIRHRRRDVLVLALSQGFMERAARETCMPAGSDLVERHQIRDPQIEFIGHALKAEALGGFASGRLYGEALGMALAVRFLQLCSRGSGRHEHKGGMAPHRLRRVLEHIRHHLADDVRLATLARVSGLSEHRFAHNFKQSTGLSPHQYVIHERILRAKRMLRDTNLNVAEIAFALGSGSPSRFAWLFRRAEGVTPSAYRASFR